MANKRMYLVNKRTGARVGIAKYYPSTGWYSYSGVEEMMDKCFNEADFGDLDEVSKKRKDKKQFFGPPYAASTAVDGNEWELLID